MSTDISALWQAVATTNKARQQREFTTSMVNNLMVQPRFREPLRTPQLAPHEWCMEDLAKKLGMPVKKLQQWVFKRWVHAIHRPFDSTWVLWADDNELDRLRQLLNRVPKNQSPPPELRTPTYPSGR